MTDKTPMRETILADITEIAGDDIALRIRILAEGCCHAVTEFERINTLQVVDETDSDRDERTLQWRAALELATILAKLYNESCEEATSAGVTP